MKKAVIYARYSSHSQREESIEGQLRKCYEFAERNDLTVVGEYIDRAISGKTDNRADFQRMIKDSEKGLFSVIIMYTLDRFARNRYDSAIYKAKLKKNGVKIFYTEQSITDEPEGIILESLLEGMAEYYSENLSRGVKRGMKENALKCMITGGYMPLGYRKTVDKKYEIDPQTAPIVQEIFDLYANGKTQRQIVDILNEKGYRTAIGKPFRVGSMTSILTNKKYIGIYEFDDVVIEDGVPAIISKDTFDKVQSMLTHNKRSSGRMKAPMQYLLTGKLFCGKCGSAMVGESGTSKNGTIHNYYTCVDRKKFKSCDKHNEKKEALEKAVVNATIEHILQPGIIENIAEKIVEITEREFNDKSRLEALNSQLKETQSSIQNLLKLVEKGITTDDISTRLLELNSDKSDLQKQIHAEEIKKPSLTKEIIVYWLTNFINDGSADEEEYQRRIIDTLVNKVYVFDENDGGSKLVITYNTSAKKSSTITLNDAKKLSSCSDFNNSLRPKIASKRLLGCNFLLNCCKDSRGAVVKLLGVVTACFSLSQVL